MEKSIKIYSINTAKVICLAKIISFNLSNHWYHLCEHGRLLFHSIRLQSFHSTRLAMNILFYMTLWPASVLLVWFWMYHSTWLAYSTCLTVLVVFYLINHDRSTLLHIIIIVLFRHSSCHNYKIIIISDYRILFIFFLLFLTREERNIAEYVLWA